MSHAQPFSHQIIVVTVIVYRMSCNDACKMAKIQELNPRCMKCHSSFMFAKSFSCGCTLSQALINTSHSIILIQSHWILLFNSLKAKGWHNTAHSIHVQCVFVVSDQDPNTNECCFYRCININILQFSLPLILWFCKHSLVRKTEWPDECVLAFRRNTRTSYRQRPCSNPSLSKHSFGKSKILLF